MLHPVQFVFSQESGHLLWERGIVTDENQEKMEIKYYRISIMNKKE